MPNNTLRSILWDWLKGDLDLPARFPHSRVASMGLASNGVTTGKQPDLTPKTPYASSIKLPNGGYLYYDVNNQPILPGNVGSALPPASITPAGRPPSVKRPNLVPVVTPGGAVVQALPAGSVLGGALGGGTQNLFTTPNPGAGMTMAQQAAAGLIPRIDKYGNPY